MTSLDSSPQLQSAGTLPGPPGWVTEFVDGAAAAWAPIGRRRTVRVRDAGPFALVSVRVQDAMRLGAEAFADEVRAAYAEIALRLGRRAACHPVRLWNFIPGILDPLGAHPQRYMAFNAARFEACEAWFGSSAQFPQKLATASGVGHRGDDLLIHCLAAQHPGLTVENPRQVAAYRYSRRYGRRPPCFSRAVVVVDSGLTPRWLMVGGTASIVGEDSRHDGSLSRQLLETMRNLATLIGAVRDRDGRECGADDQAGPASLRRFEHLRIYHPRPADREPIRCAIAEAAGGLRSVEWVHADLCRPELLVEIEGLVRLNDHAAPAASPGAMTARS